MVGPASFKSLLSSAMGFLDKAKELSKPQFKMRDTVTGRRKRFNVTGKRGKKRTPYNHLIKIEPGKVHHRQVGIKWRHGEAVPLMQAYRPIRVLHATKGWRTYTNVVPGLGRVV